LLAFAKHLFEKNQIVTDLHTWDKTRPQIYASLAELAEESLGEDFNRELFDHDTALYRGRGALNGGNLCGGRLLENIRHHREFGIHVTPTVKVGACP
jgi:hypothetical protein